MVTRMVTRTTNCLSAHNSDVATSMLLFLAYRVTVVAAVVIVDVAAASRHLICYNAFYWDTPLRASSRTVG